MLRFILRGVIVRGEQILRAHLKHARETVDEIDARADLARNDALDLREGGLRRLRQGLVARGLASVNAERLISESPNVLRNDAANGGRKSISF